MKNIGGLRFADLFAGLGGFHQALTRELAGSATFLLKHWNPELAEVVKS